MSDRPYKLYKAVRELKDEDWKTQIAQGYDNIPQGAVVKMEGQNVNFYGRYARVRYNGRVYDVPQDGIEPIDTAWKNSGGFAECMFCGSLFPFSLYFYDYCPNCGEFMNGKKLTWQGRETAEDGDAKHEMTAREFVEAIGRMCDAPDYPCRKSGGCPFDADGFDCNVRFMAVEDIDFVQRWAAEHKEVSE